MWNSISIKFHSPLFLLLITPFSNAFILILLLRWRKSFLHSSVFPSKPLVSSELWLRLHAWLPSSLLPLSRWLLTVNNIKTALRLTSAFYAALIAIKFSLHETRSPLRTSRLSIQSVLFDTPCTSRKLPSPTEPTIKLTLTASTSKDTFRRTALV